MEHCNCKVNCNTLSRSAFRVANSMCTSFCHGGRGNNKKCTTEDDIVELGSEDNDNVSETAETDD